MASKSDYLEAAILNHILRGSQNQQGVRMPVNW
jgi:hypothetical protein